MNFRFDSKKALAVVFALIMIFVSVHVVHAQSTIETFIQALDTGDTEQFHATIEILANNFGDEAIPFLIDAIASGGTIARGSIETLAKIGPTAIPELTRVLGEHAVRAGVIKALKGIEDRDAVVAALGEAKKSGQLLIQQGAKQALLEITGSVDGDVGLKKLVYQLEDEKKVRSAIKALVFLAKKGELNKVVKALKNAYVRPDLHPGIIETLNAMGNDATYSLLMENFDEITTIDILPQLNEDAQIYVRGIVRNRRLTDIRKNAAKALVARGADSLIAFLDSGAGDNISEAERFLLIAVKSEDAKTREKAIMGLARIGNPKKVLPVFVKLTFEDKNDGVREQAKYALDYIEGSIDVTPGLVAKLHGGNSAVKIRAAKVLSYMDDSFGTHSNKVITAMWNVLKNDRDNKVIKEIAKILTGSNSRREKLVPFVRKEPINNGRIQNVIVLMGKHGAPIIINAIKAVSLEKRIPLFKLAEVEQNRQYMGNLVELLEAGASKGRKGNKTSYSNACMNTLQTIGNGLTKAAEAHARAQRTWEPKKEKEESSTK